MSWFKKDEFTHTVSGKNETSFFIIFLNEDSSGVFLYCSISGKSVETVKSSPSVKITLGIEKVESV